MSWYRETGFTWKRRASMSVDNTAGAAGTIDIETVVPATWDQFWDEIDASGNEVRVVDADGSTKLVYAWSGFNRTNRTGTLQIDGYAAPAAGMLHIHVYWNASGAAAGSAAVVIAAAKTGYIETCGPPRRQIAAIIPRPGDDRPLTRWAKGSDETVHVAFDMGGRIRRRGAPFANSYACDEIDYATYVVTRAGAAQAAMVDATKTRFFAGRWVILTIAAGTVDLDYTVVPTVRTQDGAVEVPRAWLLIRDQDEA
jgi:hypothetical protein